MRRQQPAVRRYRALVRQLCGCGPVKTGGQVQISILAACNLPRRRKRDEGVPHLLRHLIKKQPALAAPSSFCHIIAYDTFGNAAALVKYQSHPTGGAGGGGGRGVCGGVAAAGMCTPIARMSYDPEWTKQNTFLLSIPPTSDCATISISVYDRYVEMSTLNKSAAAVSQAAPLPPPDRLIGEILLLREDLFAADLQGIGRTGDGGGRWGAGAGAGDGGGGGGGMACRGWLPLRKENGGIVRGGGAVGSQSGAAEVAVVCHLVSCEHSQDPRAWHQARTEAGDKKNDWLQSERLAQQRATHLWHTLQRTGPFTALLPRDENMLPRDQNVLPRDESCYENVLPRDENVLPRDENEANEEPAATPRALAAYDARQQRIVDEKGKDKSRHRGRAHGKSSLPRLLLLPPPVPGEEIIGSVEHQNEAEGQDVVEADIQGDEEGDPGKDTEEDTGEDIVSGGKDQGKNGGFHKLVLCEWDEAASYSVEIKSTLAARALCDWHFQRRVGAVAVCKHVFSDKMRYIHTYVCM